MGVVKKGQFRVVIRVVKRAVKGGYYRVADKRQFRRVIRMVNMGNLG